jgi:hypothetical protein
MRTATLFVMALALLVVGATEQSELSDAQGNYRGILVEHDYCATCCRQNELFDRLARIEAALELEPWPEEE